MTIVFDPAEKTPVSHAPLFAVAVCEILSALVHVTLSPAFTVTLAAGIDVPATWGCRCGAPARPAGSTDPGSGQTERDRCMALLLRRRSRAELEQLLAERLADTAQQRDRPLPSAR